MWGKKCATFARTRLGMMVRAGSSNREMVQALGIAGDFGADYPGRVELIGSPPDTADASVNDLHLERAGRGAIVRAEIGRAHV